MKLIYCEGEHSKVLKNHRHSGKPLNPIKHQERINACLNHVANFIAIENHSQAAAHIKFRIENESNNQSI